MRRGTKPHLIFNDGKVVGVNLGADFCAEHEWGISPLKREFGIPEDISVYGLKRRKISIFPSRGLQWFRFSQNSGFAYHTWEWEKSSDVSRELSKFDTSLRGAWSDTSFGVITDNVKESRDLEEIFSQFKELNIVFTFGATRTPVFDNPGLIIAIADRLPKDVIEMWEKADRAYHEIRQEVDATGIEGLLKKRGKGYYALSPSKQSDGSLKFWLNPVDQQRNNYGWFTLKDLQEWAEDKGPIPMKVSK